MQTAIWALPVPTFGRGPVKWKGKRHHSTAMFNRKTQRYLRKTPRSFRASDPFQPVPRKEIKGGWKGEIWEQPVPLLQPAKILGELVKKWVEVTFFWSTLSIQNLFPFKTKAKGNRFCIHIGKIKLASEPSCHAAQFPTQRCKAVRFPFYRQRFFPFWGGTGETGTLRTVKHHRFWAARRRQYELLKEEAASAPFWTLQWQWAFPPTKLRILGAFLFGSFPTILQRPL